MRKISHCMSLTPISILRPADDVHTRSYSLCSNVRPESRYTSSQERSIFSAAESVDKLLFYICCKRMRLQLDFTGTSFGVRSGHRICIVATHKPPHHSGPKGWAYRSHLTICGGY
jgi:hypothetical protein